MHLPSWNLGVRQLMTSGFCNTDRLPSMNKSIEEFRHTHRVQQRGKEEKERKRGEERTSKGFRTLARPWSG